MYLAKHHRYGVTYLVFTVEDPRDAGFRGDVVEGVTLDYSSEAVHQWRDGDPRPDPCVGQSTTDPAQYRVFKNPLERERAGFLPLDGSPLAFGSWEDYVNLHHIPPDPDQTAADRWFDYLDRVDAVARQRRAGLQEAVRPAGTSRDEVAAWVARTNLMVDNAVQEIWYLPSGSPPEEIRLLELNDRVDGPEPPAPPIDFGLDVEGAPFRLLVADVNTEQLDRIKQHTSWLPPGWGLDGRRVWRRGA